MFTDPQTITVNAVAKDLARIQTERDKSVYRTADAEYKFSISHQESGKRTRRLVRVDKTVVAADPLTAVNASQTLGVYIVVDKPTFGFTDTDIGYVVAALTAWLSGANVTKLLTGQH